MAFFVPYTVTTVLLRERMAVPSVDVLERIFISFQFNIQTEICFFLLGHTVQLDSNVVFTE